MKKALAHLEAHFGAYIRELEALIRIPSVSFPGYDPALIARSAEAVKALLERSGFTRVAVHCDGGALPCVIGEYESGPSRPTVLLYAHHDVQPPMREECWLSPPFEPVTRRGRIYGRGSCDDKASVVAIAAMLSSLIQGEGACPVNLKVLIEGEEEIGSPGLEALLREHRQRLLADLMVVADAGSVEVGHPALTVSLRGMCSAVLTLRALKNPQHSGVWSGPIPDPAMGLVKMLSALCDEGGRPAFDATVPPPSPLMQPELESMRRLSGEGAARFREEAGLLPGVELLDREDRILERIWRESALTLTALEAGSLTKGGNVIQDVARARVSLRVPPGVPVNVAEAWLHRRLRESLPWGLHLDIAGESSCEAWSTDTSHPLLSLAKEALEEGYGHTADFIGCGASIPVVETLSRHLGGVPAILTASKDPLSLLHSENESQDLGDLKNEIRSLILMMKKLASLSTAADRKQIHA
ncbi:MAG: M20/M25/M40 family metallo-hydrolase [Planctomycetes bacterium]|nr:M20/M25/M40 family metallo-hydrolase [Planctomycetota bacterium]